MVSLLALSLLQVNVTNPNAALNQAKLCLKVMGYEVPKTPPMSFIQKKDKWLIGWTGLDFQFDQRGVLLQFEAKSHDYHLLPKRNYPGSKDTAKLQNYLAHTCRALGMLEKVADQSLRMHGGSAPKLYSSTLSVEGATLILKGKENNGKITEQCRISCWTNDGAIRSYRLSSSEYWSETAATVGTFKLKD